MRNPQEYRDRARECVELARAAGRDRPLLLKIAESSLKLADQVDGESKLLEKTA